MSLPALMFPPIPGIKFPSPKELLTLYYAQLERVTNAERTLHREQIALQKIRDLMKAREQKESK